MNFPPTTPLSRLLMTSKLRFLCDGKAGVLVLCHFWQLSSPLHALFAPLKPAVSLVHPTFQKQVKWLIS